MTLSKCEFLDRYLCLALEPLAVQESSVKASTELYKFCGNICQFFLAQWCLYAAWICRFHVVKDIKPSPLLPGYKCITPSFLFPGYICKVFYTQFSVISTVTFQNSASEVERALHKTVLAVFVIQNVCSTLGYLPFWMVFPSIFWGYNFSKCF